MNLNIFQKLALALAGATLSFTVIEAHPADAEIITYDFNDNSSFLTTINSGGLSLTGQGNVTYSMRPTSVPEPGTDLGFSGLGILGLGWLKRKKIASSQRA